MTTAALPAAGAGMEDALLDETATLARLSSVSGAEGPIASYAEAILRAVPALSVARIGHTLVATTASRADCGRLLLAGHTDTVPPSDPPQPVARELDRVTGRGVVDMKGGVAVMLQLARHAVATARLACTIVLYDREELGSHRSGMRMLADSHPALLAADAGIVLEPTSGWVECGCQGSVRLRMTYRGVAAHSARPWRGVNAVRRAAPDLARCAATVVAPVTVGEFVFPQALEVVGVSAGAGGNTLPDRCEVEVNARYAPTRPRAQVVDDVTSLFPDADEVTITLDSPAAMPDTDAAVLAPLVRSASVRRRPKLGWTDVGRLAQLGIPAINFGPGDPELAHSPHEVVTGEDLLYVYGWIRELLG